MIDLKDYICKVPFEILEVHDNSYFLCCTSWLKKHLPKNSDLKNVWNSEEAKDIRKSIIDGSYKYCDRELCPYLSYLNKIEKTNNTPIIKKSEVEDLLNNYNFETGEINIGPKIVHFSFDRSCNYKCPSCRIDFINANKEKIKKIDLTIKDIENNYANNLEMIYCSGTADPFASVSYRKFLREFEPSKYPNLKYIHLHTNASLWNKKMWNSMPNIHQFVKSCEISIDAGKKETYENVTRLGGNWENLLKNLHFISTLQNLEYVKCSFVVQNSNYKEMSAFVELIIKIFGLKAKVFFGTLTNWGTFSNSEFNEKNVTNKNHPNHNDFLNEFKKISLHPQVLHNLYQFSNYKKTLI